MTKKAGGSRHRTVSITLNPSGRTTPARLEGIDEGLQNVGVISDPGRSGTSPIAQIQIPTREVRNPVSLLRIIESSIQRPTSPRTGSSDCTGSIKKIQSLGISLTTRMVASYLWPPFPSILPPWWCTVLHSPGLYDLYKISHPNHAHYNG